MSAGLKTLAVLGLAAAASAFDRISVPATVTAGKETTLTVKNDLGTEGSFDANFAYFRVYLTVSPPGWGLNPVCWLANQTSVDVTAVKVTVPASVGPAGDNYTLSVMEYNTDPDAESSASGFSYTGEFALEGATGEFSAYETDPSGPWSLGDADRIPCSAYDCVRQCASKYYPADIPSDDGDLAAIKDQYLCGAKCPGTTFEPWQSEWDDTDGDGKADLPPSSETVGAADASSTATGASKPTGTSGSPSAASTSAVAGEEGGDDEGAGAVLGVSGGLLAVGLAAGLALVL
jgi:hypothetical protein